MVAETMPVTSDNPLLGMQAEWMHLAISLLAYGHL
jgi:hypothetical protein